LGWIAVVAGVLALSSLTGGLAFGQDGQFEVASLKPDDPKGPRAATNLDLDASDYFRYQGGPVVADGYLVNYLIFAYTLRDSGEYKALDARLPAWARIKGQRTFRLEARAGEHPTKDSLRGMVRSLLAERFGLRVHREIQQQTAWVMVQTAGSQGRATQLRPHTGAPVCTTVVPESKPAAKARAGEAPPYCGALLLREEEGFHLRIQDFTMAQIAGELGMLGAREGMEDLAAVDGTRMPGRFDLDLHFARGRAAGGVEAPGADAEPDFLQALATEAGLEFKKRTVPVEVLVVDEVHEPNAN
jgi:uncharacterized protein (TIGR03435 family)